ncbi:MAG TPA: GGDEF domain-containing protein [Methylophilaceae bacterium]|nr:GGDEF domain-containing protein [Methylophilaceae bacterium]
MPTFDLKTIIFMSMLLTFMLSMLLAITRSHHKEVSGPGFWAIGNLVVGLGMVILFSKFESTQWNILPGVVLIGVGLGLFVNGIQAFSGKRVRYLLPILIGAFLGITNAMIILMMDELRVIIMFNAFVFSIIYFLGARLTFGKDDGLVGNLYWIASSLFFMMALLLMARSLSAFYMEDNLFKNFLDWPVNGYTLMLACVIQFFVSVLFVLMLTAQVNQDLQSMATVDSLTNVLNRRGLQDSALKMHAICKRLDIPMALLLADLDHFKKVNDTYGHLVGDEVLIVIAKTIKNTLRAGDVVGRYGGEEFCILLPNTSESEAVALAERIREIIQQKAISIRHVKKTTQSQSEIHCTVSIGAVGSESVGYDVQRLLASADNALYMAKNRGRNLVATNTGIATKSAYHSDEVS